MKTHISRRTIIIALAVILVLIAVGVVAFLNAANDIFANISTADCREGILVTVWHDKNRDGLRGEDELALLGVSVQAYDVLRNSPDPVASGVTDASGTFSTDWFVAGCPETAIEVVANAPAGLCATTPERLNKPPHDFGFAACETSDG